MIGVRPGKIAVFPLLILALKYVIHQTKGIIFLVFLINVILQYFLGLYFSIVHNSTNIVLNKLKPCVPVGETCVEGTVSQNFVLGFSFYFRQKKG